jgi:hypothetical protein
MRVAYHFINRRGQQTKYKMRPHTHTLLVDLVTYTPDANRKRPRNKGSNYLSHGLQELNIFGSCYTPIPKITPSHI